MEIRGVLFDFGYTLFAHAALDATIVECARGLGAMASGDDAVTLAARIDAAAMAPAELSHPRDLDATVWAQRWRLLYGIADEFVVGLGAALYSSMHDPRAWVPYRDAAATLQALSDVGVEIGVISNTGWDVRTAFSAHSMSGCVRSFTLSYETGFVKPDPHIFASACTGLGLDAEQVLMVGDDPRSDGGAVAAGIRTVLLPAREPGSDNSLSSIVRFVLGR